MSVLVSLLFSLMTAVATPVGVPSTPVDPSAIPPEGPSAAPESRPGQSLGLGSDILPNRRRFLRDRRTIQAGLGTVAAGGALLAVGGIVSFYGEVYVFGEVSAGRCPDRSCDAAVKAGRGLMFTGLGALSAGSITAAVGATQLARSHRRDAATRRPRILLGTGATLLALVPLWTGVGLLDEYYGSGTLAVLMSLVGAGSVAAGTVLIPTGMARIGRRRAKVKGGLGARAVWAPQLLRGGGGMSYRLAF